MTDTQDDGWKCEEHGLNGAGHAEAGIPMWKLMDCLYHGAELKDGGTFDEGTGKDISNRIAARLERMLGDRE